MGLQHHQHGQHPQNQQVGCHAVPGGVHLVLLLGDGVGEIQHHRHLGHLRGLKLEAGVADAQPAGGVVPGEGNGVAGDDDQHQQHDGQIQQRLRRAAKALVVDFADQEHAGHTGDGKDALLAEVLDGVVVVVIGGGETGGEQHH